MPHPSRRSIFALAAAIIIASFSTASVRAEGVSVAASIAPVHSLAMMVAGERAKVTLLVPPQVSPHDFDLMPSSAKALSDSDLVVRVGAGLDGFLDGSIDVLNSDANILTFSEVPGVELLPIRTETHWEAHDDHHAEGKERHGAEEETHAKHDDGHHDEHGAHEDDHHDEHDEHADQKDHDAHGHHDHHDHGPNDPHVWLDTANARAGVAAIAEALSEIDPEGAETYAANAKAADVRLAELQARMAERLNPVSDRPYAVFHDAYQYLEHRFDLHALGSISGIDGAAPSPRRLMAIQKAIRESGAVCVFSEPQFDQGLVTVATEGSGAKSAVLDPLGSSIPMGPEHYIKTMDAMTDILADCLG